MRVDSGHDHHLDYFEERDLGWQMVACRRSAG